MSTKIIPTSFAYLHCVVWLECLRSRDEHYPRLRGELRPAEEQIGEPRERLRRSERLEAMRTEVGLKRTQLSMALQDEIRERGECIREAVFEGIFRGTLPACGKPNRSSHEGRAKIRGPYGCDTQQGNSEHANSLFR